MKRITSKYLASISACTDARTAFEVKFPKGASVDVVFKVMFAEKELDWAGWLIARLLNHKNRIHYAIYAAEQVIEIFEKKYPDDKRPRLAIEAAKAVLKKNNKANRDAAGAAAYAAYAAADAAADAASKAAYAASKAAYAASKAEFAAAMKQKIIEHGLKLLKSQLKSQ
jgi:hypothetical protein